MVLVSLHVRCLMSAPCRILAWMFTSLKANHKRSEQRYNLNLRKMGSMITKRFYS